jgi:exosortase
MAVDPATEYSQLFRLTRFPEPAGQALKRWGDATECLRSSGPERLPRSRGRAMELWRKRVGNKRVGTRVALCHPIPVTQEAITSIAGTMSCSRQCNVIAVAFAIVVVGWWVLDLQHHWRNLPDYQYGWIVLFLTLYLVWERLDNANVSAKEKCGPSVLLTLVGIPFVVLAELYKRAFGSTPASSFSLSIGCALFMLALFVTVRGADYVKTLLFPIGFFFLAVPAPGVLWRPVVRALQQVLTIIDVEMLNMMGVSAVQRGNTIALPNCIVGIDQACSGIRSLQSSVMAGLFIGNLKFRRPATQAAFAMLAVVLSLVGNMGRAICLSIVAHCKGKEALEHWHDATGWTVFVFCALALTLAAGFLTRRWPNCSK